MRYDTAAQASAAASSMRATSTQLPPLPLRLLFCHVTMVSMQLPPLPLWLLLRHEDAGRGFVMSPNTLLIV
jgi:hypothetical protein